MRGGVSYLFVVKQLDATDYVLLSILQADGRVTNSDLAKRVKLSPPSVLQRVKHLERYGYIKGYTALLDAEKLNLKITVLALVSLALHEEDSMERLIQEFTDMPEVMECHHVSGEFDFLIKIVVEDMRSYERLLREHILKVKGIGQIRSSFVLASPKVTTSLPIKPAPIPEIVRVPRRTQRRR